MEDFILLMHDDTVSAPDDAAWSAQFSLLQTRGVFVGGSAIGGGVCLRVAGNPEPLTRTITGFIRVRAASLDAAKALVAGNPVYDCGRTVEVRTLPRD